MRAATVAAIASVDGVQSSPASLTHGAICPNRRVQVATYTTSLTTVSFNFTSFDGSGAHLVYSWNLGITPQQVKPNPVPNRTPNYDFTLTLSKTKIYPLPKVQPWPL